MVRCSLSGLVFIASYLLQEVSRLFAPVFHSGTVLMDVKRSDRDEKDVSKYQQHLSELAEERRVGTKDVPGDPTPEFTQKESGSTDALPGTNVDVVGQGGAPASGPEGGESGAASVSESVDSKRKHRLTLIRARRTDHENWDARVGLGETVGGLCCWKRGKELN